MEWSLYWTLVGQVSFAILIFAFWSGVAVYVFKECASDKEKK